jgi:uncharacterized protein (TIGR02597 family)
MDTYKNRQIPLKNSNFACSPSMNSLTSRSPHHLPQMRRFLSLFAVLIATVTFASAQSVTTIPVGFETATIPAAASASNPSNTPVFVPFYPVADFQGAVSTVDSSSALSISGAAFTANQFTTTPHLARLKSGASVGRFFFISANTATQLTLDTFAPDPVNHPYGAGYTLTTGAPSNTQAQVNVGDSVEILPANTLGTLFGTSTVPFLTGTPDVADNIFLFNGTSYDLYYHNGTNWRKNGNLSNQNNAVVLPDRGLFILRRGGALNLTFLGTVPSTTERTDFPGAGSTFKGTRFPVDMTLAGTNQLNLQTLPGWLKSTDPTAADSVYIWNGASWDQYYHNGTNWRKSGNLANQDTKVIPLGAAMFVIRQSGATGNTSTLVQPLPYSL